MFLKGVLWTKEEDDLLRRYLGEGKSFQQVSDLIQTRNRQSCESRAKKLKIRSTFVWQKKKTNETFWSIPNALNCYWAGFAATDGCLTYYKKIKTNTDMYSFQFLLGLKDLKQVEKFKQDTQSENEISLLKSKLDIRFCKITVSCCQWGLDLQKNFNITPRKTFTLQPPNLTNESLIFSFIIGAVDGDGCIRLNSKRLPVVYLTGASYNFIKWVFDILLKYFPRSLTGTVPKIYTRKGENSPKYDISLSGLRACQIIDYLRQYSCPKLSRKWDQPEVLEIIDQYKKDYPEFFDFSHLPTPI